MVVVFKDWWSDVHPTNVVILIVSAGRLQVGAKTGNVPYKHGDSDCVYWLFAGRIDDRTCALQIGHGLGYDSLKGSVDDVSIPDAKTALGHFDEVYQWCWDCLGCVNDITIIFDWREFEHLQGINN